MIPRELPSAWRTHAALFRLYGAEEQACVLDRVATQLEEALVADENDLLTPAAAAADPEVIWSSADHIAELVREGKLENRGVKHRPLVRRGDLPRRPKVETAAPSAGDYVGDIPTLEAFGRSVVASRRGK